MKNIIYSLTYSASSRAVIFLVNILSARLLIPEDYGTLSYLLGIIGSLAAISAFGSGTSTNIHTAKNIRTNIYAAQKLIITSALLTSIVSISLSIIIIPLLSPSDDWNLQTQTYILIAASIWILSIGGITEGSLNGAGEYKTLAKNSIYTLILTIPLSAALIWQCGLLGALTSIFAHRLLIACLNSLSMSQIGLLNFRIAKGNIFDSNIISILKSTSLPSLLGALMVAPVIALSMRMLMNQDEGPTQLAYFSWTYQIYLMAVFIPSSLGSYFISRFSLTGTSKSLIKMLIPNIVFSALIVAILFALKPIILGIAGESYVTNASNIFNILIPVVILYSANSIFASYWPSKGKAWFGFFMNFVWAGTVLIITWLTANNRGGESIAIAFATGYFILLIAQSIAARHIEAVKNQI